MHITSKIFFASAVTILFAQVALSDTTSPDNYSIIALKNCQVVSNNVMTADQLEAYLSLKQQEQKMHSLEAPIKNIEQEIEVYTDNIERLAKLAIHETADTLHIDKKLLKQQDEAAKKFAQFMHIHQDKFDAIGSQGEVVGNQAKIFETSIEASLDNIDYDQIQILTPDSQHNQFSCDNNIRILTI